jgi:hypothetical protein
MFVLTRPHVAFGPNGPNPDQQRSWPSFGVLQVTEVTRIASQPVV